MGISNGLFIRDSENTKLEPKALCLGIWGKTEQMGKLLSIKIKELAVCSIELGTENKGSKSE